LLEGFKGNVCLKCGAIRKDDQIGMEETPEEYVAKLVEVFRELRRVLRDDGTCWLNLGDSYIGYKGANYGVNSELSNLQKKSKIPTSHMTGTPQTSNLKPKDLVGIPWRVAFALQADGWWLRSDIVWHKCLSGGTVVYAKTEKGEGPATIKDLVRLNPENVKLWTGEKWSQVLSWIETKPKEGRKARQGQRRSRKYRTGETLPPSGEIEVHLRSGEKIGCTDDHRFPTQRGLVEAGNLKPGDILQNCITPEPEQPIAPKFIPDNVGWFVGLYLAEGSLSGDTMQISGHTKEVERWIKLEDLVNDYGGHYRLYSDSNSANAHIDCKLLKAIIDTYISGKLAKGKHLNASCWLRPNDFLYQILQGYLDGDGHHDVSNNRWRLGFTKNDALAQDLRTLAGRLGFSLRLKRAKHSMGSRKFDGWRGQIKFEISAHHNNRSDFEIVSIEQSRARKFWDITIADEPHLFALASGVLTHNSNPMPESVTDRPTKSHEQIFLLTKSARYWYDHVAIMEAANYDGRNDTLMKGADKLKAVPGQSPNSMFTDGAERWPNKTADGQSGRNKRTVWTIPTKPFKGAHFAVFPPKLIEPCILAGCPSRVCAECGTPWVRVVEKIGKSMPVSDRHGRTGHNGQPPQISGNYWEGPTTSPTDQFAPQCQCSAPHRPGVVLDPFMGSGTTAAVAIANGRDWLGIELNAEYIKLAQERMIKSEFYRLAEEREVLAARIDDIDERMKALL
jgi:DNA modification methylase